MDDSAPTHERRKPTKICSLENGLMLLKYAGRPTPKKKSDENGVEKQPQT